MPHPSTQSLFKWRGDHATMTTTGLRDNNVIIPGFISTHPATHLWWHLICQMSEQQSELHRTGSTAPMTAALQPAQPYMPCQVNIQMQIMSAMLCVTVNCSWLIFIWVSFGYYLEFKTISLRAASLLWTLLPWGWPLRWQTGSSEPWLVDVVGAIRSLARGAVKTSHGWE